MNVEDKFHVSTKLLELANINPATHPLLAEATPLMQKLSNDLDQSCHLTVYSQGRQIVLFKIDAPSGMGFSVRMGAELDVLISASGRVLLAFQDSETRLLRLEESLERRPQHQDPQINTILDAVAARGFESIHSVQVRGLYAVSFPILDSQRHALAALTVPYAERIDKAHRQTIPAVEEKLRATAGALSARMGSGLA